MNPTEKERDKNSQGTKKRATISCLEMMMMMMVHETSIEPEYNGGYASHKGLYLYRRQLKFCCTRFLTAVVYIFPPCWPQ